MFDRKTPVFSEGRGKLWSDPHAKRINFTRAFDGKMFVRAARLVLYLR
jgi:hypothetical protein